MEDLLKRTEKLKDGRIEIEFYYKLNFDADQTCGYIKVYDNAHERDEEKFEVYMELLECGLDKKAATAKLDHVINEINTGSLDVIF